MRPNNSPKSGLCFQHVNLSRWYFCITVPHPPMHQLFSSSCARSSWGLNNDSACNLVYTSASKSFFFPHRERHTQAVHKRFTQFTHYIGINISNSIMFFSLQTKLSHITRLHEVNNAVSPQKHYRLHRKP